MEGRFLTGPSWDKSKVIVHVSPTIPVSNSGRLTPRYYRGSNIPVFLMSETMILWVLLHVYLRLLIYFSRLHHTRDNGYCDFPTTLCLFPYQLRQFYLDLSNTCWCLFHRKYEGHSKNKPVVDERYTKGHTLVLRNNV